jgi:hypothetical protein
MLRLLRAAVISSLSFALPAAADDTTGLVGWWSFDENQGEISADKSGNGHDATLVNAGWGEGITNGGLMLDGGNDGIVTIPMADDIRATSRSITLMAWTYRTAEHNVAVVASAYPMLFFGFHGPQFKLELTERPGLLSRVGQKIGLTSEVEVECYADFQHVAELNRWIHLAATYDGQMARLYADGSEVCALPFEGEIGYGDEPLTIGGYLERDGRIIDEITGRLDDVRIYNRILSPDEIRASFEAGAERIVGQ